MAADAHGWRLDRALAAAVPTLSRERLKALISSGEVLGPEGRQVRDPAAKAVPGGTYEVTVPAPAPAHNEPQDIALEIVHEDDHLIVVDKPAGLVVHPAAGNLDGTLVNALLHHCAGRLSGIGGVARPGIVHRIDKDTSGLMVVAKTDVTHEGWRRSSPSTASSGAIWRSSPGCRTRRAARSTRRSPVLRRTGRRWRSSMRAAASAR